jgi:hypothetical protein
MRSMFFYPKTAVEQLSRGWLLQNRDGMISLNSTAAAKYIDSCPVQWKLRVQTLKSVFSRVFSSTTERCRMNSSVLLGTCKTLQLCG